MFLRAALLVFSALQLPYLVIATLNRLDDLDGRIAWTPQAEQSGKACFDKPSNNVCTGFWWSATVDNHHAGGFHQTWGPDTSMTFTFNGSSFMIFGPKSSTGASGVVTVDGRDAGTFSSTAEGVLVALPQQLLFMQSDLDATQQHTVVVKYDQRTFGSTGTNRRWLGIDYVLVDEQTQGGSSPPSQQDLKLASSAMKGAAIGLVVAVILLAVLAVGLAMILVVVLRRRRTHSHPHLQLHSNSQPQSHSQPLTHPRSHSHLGIPSLQTSEFSDSRRPSTTTESSYPAPSTIQTKFVHVIPPPMSSAHSPSEVASTNYDLSEPVPYLLNPKAVVDSVAVVRPNEKAAVLGLAPPLYQRVKEKD